MKRLKVLTKLQEIRFFSISCFTVSVAPFMNTLESSNDFINLIRLAISSFEINKVNRFPAPFLLIIFFKFIYCI